MSSRKILIMAGGTGGHVYPALAVANEIRERSHDVVWLGTHRGLESRVVPAAGIDIEWISVSGLRGKGALTLIAAPFRLLFALLQSLRVVIRHRPAAVLGMGGFVSGPGGVAAWLLRRPLIVHEQNAVAGLTNRLLARLARVVLQAFPGSFSANDRVITTGNPVRRAIAEVSPPEARMAQDASRGRLLVIGGSLGARALNQIVPAALACIPAAERPQVRHQTGERTADEARAAYADAGVDVTLETFIEDMAEAYGWADVIVCRAGALTVAEVAAVGLPAVFVPFPHAVDDHQTANARSLADAGAAIVLQESELDAERLARVLQTWFADREQLVKRARLSRAQAKPDALEKITDICLEAAGVVA